MADGSFHDKYKAGVSRAYDVAVLNLNQAVTGIKPIKLNTPDQAGVALESPGSVLTAAGWGQTSPVGSGSGRLNEVQLRVIPDRTAQQIWSARPPAFHYTPALMVATDAQGGKDIAQGDSGGPLFNPGATPTQVGIVSYGGTEPPTTGSKPTAYTDINNAEISKFIVEAAVLEPTAR